MGVMNPLRFLMRPNIGPGHGKEGNSEGVEDPFAKGFCGEPEISDLSFDLWTVKSKILVPNKSSLGCSHLRLEQCYLRLTASFNLAKLGQACFVAGLPAMSINRNLALAGSRRIRCILVGG